MLTDPGDAVRTRPVRRLGAWPGRPERPRLVGGVEHACPIGTEHLVVAGTCRPGDPEAAAPSTRLTGRAVLLGAGTRFVGVVPAALDISRPALLDLVILQAAMDPDRVTEVDVEELAWLGLSGAGDEDRVRAASFLASTVLSGGDRLAGGDALADRKGSSDLASLHLHRFREAVRPRRPPCVIAADQPQGLFVESLHRVDARSFYIRGWARDAAAPVRALRITAPEGATTDLTAGLVRFPRPDVEEFYGVRPGDGGADPAGFLAFFELPAPSHRSDGWIIEMLNENGDDVETAVPPALSDHTTLRTMVLNDLHHGDADDRVLRDHVFPCLSALQDRTGRVEAIASVTEYGVVPESPEVSVIVPLYQRIDFVEHQLAQFADDPDLQGAELIYVLDSPELADALAAAAAGLHRLYGLAFRTVVLERNCGFAGANRAGASKAHGRLLLLLNSDVIPERPGWLSAMVGFHDSRPDVGAVGPKLLYEDNSIQHAGMYFSRPEAGGLWENEHFYKGLHRSFPPANRARPVPAITGACLLISRELWDRVGGLKGIYVQGDFEDSDLCLRLADLGYGSWYLPEVELYHLEGQSYPTPMRQLTSRFNKWLHTHLWDARITEVMAPPSLTTAPANPGAPQ